eukprot:g1334.t1
MLGLRGCLAKVYKSAFLHAQPGTYSPVKGAFNCTKCGEGTTTHTFGASQCEPLSDALVYEPIAECANFTNKTLKVGVVLECELDMDRWRPTFETELNNYFNRYQCYFEQVGLYVEQVPAALSSKEIDFLFCDPGVYTAHNRKGTLRVLSSILRIFNGHLSAQYGGLLFRYSSRNVDLNTFQDLKHVHEARSLKVCTQSQGAFGAWTMQAYELFKLGMPAQNFGAVVITEGKEDTVAKVVAGDCDLGMVRAAHITLHHTTLTSHYITEHYILSDVGGGADSIFSPPPGWAASQSTSVLSPPLSALSAIDEGGGSQPDLSSLSNNNDDNDNNDSNDTNDTDTDSSISFPVHLFPSPSRSLPPQPLQAPPAPPSSASSGLPAQPSATSSAPAVPTLVYTSSPPPPPPGIPPPPPPASLPSSDSMADLSTLSTLRASLSSPDPSPQSLSALRVSSVPVSSDTSDTESAEEDETAPAPPPLPPASPAHRLTRHRRHTSSDLEVSLRRQPSRSSTPPPPLAEGREATEVTSMAPTMATGKPRTPGLHRLLRPLQASARASPPVRHRRNSHGHGSGNHAHGSPARRGSTDHAHGSPARRGSRSHNESPDPSPLRPPKDLRIDSSTPQGFSQKHINKTRPRAHSDSQSDLMPPPVPAVAMSAHPLVVPPQTTRPGLPGARTNFASPPRKPVIPAPPATSSHATTSTHAAAGAGPERPPLAKEGSAVNVVKDNGSPLSMLHQILANPAQQELLMTFLTKEFSEENLLFWRAVKALQEKWEETASATSPATSPDERPLMLALLEQMQSLWAEFVQPGADKQINVPYGVVKSIRAKLDALKCFASPEKKSDSGNQSTPGKKPSPPQRIPPPVPILGAAPPESPAADTTEDKDKENDKDEGNDENKLASPAQHKTKTAHLVTPSGASPMKLTPRAKHSKHTEAVREAIEAFVESSAVVSQLIARDSLQRFLKSAIWLEREDNPENKSATGENKALAGDKQVAKGKSKVQAGANKVARLRLGGWGGRSGLEEGSTLSPREQEQNFEKAAAIVRELETRPVESWTKEERDAYRTQSQSLKGSKSHQTGRTWRRPASELQAMLTAGQAALGEGLKDYAVGYFSQVLKTQPGHVEALVLRSRAHREMGNTELARKDALRASVVDNQYAPAHFALGQVYVDVRMLELAELELFRAYRLDPDLAGLATPLLQVSRQNHRRVPIRSGFLRRRTEGGCRCLRDFRAIFQTQFARGTLALERLHVR